MSSKLLVLIVSMLYNNNVEFIDYRTKIKLEHKIINTKGLKIMPQFTIRCGINGGLPFETLMTDVISGCLNINNVCYGNCTACDFWLKHGYNFGKRINNIFDKKLFIKDIENLPNDVKWLRQGWSSDCSFSNESWKLIASISELLIKYSISLLIITKVHKIPSIDILKTLAKNNTEIRVSLSAFDTKEEFNKRFNFLYQYKSLGGKAIPYVMTALFNNKILANNQKIIVRKIVEGDFIAGEHPLRISTNNPIYKLLKHKGFIHNKFIDQYWFGRVLNKVPNFILPPPTHLPNNYNLVYKSFSECNKKTYQINYKNLPTYEELKNNPNIFTEEMNKHAAYIIQGN